MQIEKPSQETNDEKLNSDTEQVAGSENQEAIQTETTEVTTGPAGVAEPPVTQTHEEAEGEPVKEKESAFKRFLNFLFGRETRVGRFMRPFLRVTALIVGMFALGVLVTYFTLYIPLRTARDQALAEIQRINLELETTRADLEQTQAALNDLQTSSDATIADLQQQNDLANFKVNFLIVKNDVLRARLAMLDNNNEPGGPTAMAALNDLDSHLQDLLPDVQKVDPVLAGLLQDRLNVVKGELVRDAQQAKVELESFYSNLLELENTLFK